MIKSCLLIATRKDRASLNIANNLLRMFQWKEIQADSFSPLENKVIISKIPNNKFVILWIIDEPLLSFDKPNEKLTRLLGPQFQNNSISDILFLSKHVSTAGTASLTVHPIGIPYQEENSRSGGIPGRCSPPSNHIGALMRSVYSESKAKGLDKYFKITLEATHHGPYVEIPTCFVEIGSTEEEWDNKEAGEIWSTCLGKHFSLSTKDFLDESISVDSQFEIFDSFLELPQESSEDEISDNSKIAVICIGSGHYVPKLNDIAKFGDNFLIGHALATYAFDGLFENVEKPTKWKEIILEAVNSTKITFKDMRIVCYLDKKSFKSEHLYLIGEYLNELGVSYSDKTNDIKKML